MYRVAQEALTNVGRHARATRVDIRVEPAATRPAGAAESGAIMVSVSDKKLVFFHEMRNADTDTISAVTLFTGIHLDTRARKSCHLPKVAADPARANLMLDEAGWMVGPGGVRVNHQIGRAHV